MKVCITGATGFIGGHLSMKYANDNIEVIAIGKRKEFLFKHPKIEYHSCDFLDSSFDWTSVISENTDFIIHLAAISSPDYCELNKQETFDFNINPLLKLISISNRLKIPLVFLSTDLIFSSQDHLINELDKAFPLNFYGTTKLIGERIIQEHAHYFHIVRTSLVWGYSLGYSNKRNYFEWVLDAVKKEKSIQLVNDQKRAMTFISDLIQGIQAVVATDMKNQIWHICGDNKISPYEFSLELARLLFKPTDQIIRVSTEELQEIAKRPSVAILNNFKAKTVLNFKPQSIEQNLKFVLGLED